MIKKIIYIGCFVILGVLIGFSIHAAIEIPVINLLVADFETYNFGLNWDQWEAIHNGGTIILLILGIVVGYMQGTYWWNVIYVQKRLKR